MIWFPAFEQNLESNCYFEIRDVDIRYQQKMYSGIVTGVLGIDAIEFWTEIYLGATYDIHIFPVWNDDGHVDNIPDTVDLDMLKQDLAAEIEKILPDFHPVRYQAGPHYSEQFSFLSFEVREHQAA